MKFILFIPLLFFSLPIFASPHINSQKRFSNESFEQAARRFYMRVYSGGGKQQDDDAFMSRVPLKEVDDRYKARLPEFSSLEELQDVFEWSRDERFMQDPQFQNFKRRISWLYPDDGCFARAQVAQKIIREHLQQQQSHLGKVFIFGTLVVKTQNSPEGEVSWWYHVVPATRLGGQVMVLDAAIDPSHVMPLEEWIAHMIPQGQSDFTVSFCKNETYSPSDSCMDPDVMDMKDALNEQSFYLRYERERLIEMERKADDELGEHPPWFTAPQPPPGRPTPPRYTLQY